MKIAYVFKTDQSSTFQLSSMILPQLEQGNHMVDVIGMFFFDDNILCLQKGNEVGERLSKIAKEKNMLLMACDQCAVRRGFAEGTFEQCAAAAMTAVGSGAVSDFTILEDVDLNKIAETAKKMASGYKEPGK